MLEMRRTHKCKKCGKVVQTVKANGVIRTVNPGVVRFERCDNPYASYFVDAYGNICRGYKSDNPGALIGYQLHSSYTNCFVFPFEKETKPTKV